MRRASYAVAFGGIISALCLILEFSIGILPLFLYIFPQICALLIYILLEECGTKTSLCVYIGVSLLSLFLCPDKEGALLFVSFFGYYPILRVYIHKLKSKLLRIASKLLVFNIAMVIRYTALIFLFGMADAIDEAKWIFVMTIVMENIVFVMFDILLSRLLVLYTIKYKGKLFKRKH